MPHLRYERDWTVVDAQRGEVVFQQRMILPEPEGYDGPPFATDVWSRHRYAGDGLWSLKQDVTLSGAQADANFKGWMEAGGRFAAPLRSSSRCRRCLRWRPMPGCGRTT